MSKSVGTPLLSEKDFQRTVIDAAQMLGWLVYHDFDSRRNTRGMPDLILCRPPGRLLFCELKTEKGRLRPEQKTWLEALRSVPNLEVYLWRPSNWSEIERVLR